MAKRRYMPKAKKSLYDIVKDEYPEFFGEVNGLQQDALNNRLAQLSKDVLANEQAKKDDEELTSARRKVTNLDGPYRDLKKVLDRKTRFIVQILKDRGQG